MANQTYHSLVIQYINATNAHDADAVAACFTERAVVKDEGQEHRGLAEIKDWIEEAFRKYRFTVEFLDGTLKEQNESDIGFEGRVSGTFDGSPVVLLYELGLRDGKIATLSVALPESA